MSMPGNLKIAEGKTRVEPDQFVSAYWCIKETEKVENAKMQHIIIETANHQFKALTNYKEVEAHMPLFLYKPPAAKSARTPLAGAVVVNDEESNKRRRTTKPQP